MAYTFCKGAFAGAYATSSTQREDDATPQLTRGCCLGMGASMALRADIGLLIGGGKLRKVTEEIGIVSTTMDS